VKVIWQLSEVDPEGFEYDSRKAIKNFEKHGVAFDKAATVFLRPVAFTQGHTVKGEARCFCIGTCTFGTFAIAFCWRQGKIRIISARKAGRKEREVYRKLVFRGPESNR
jgi:uncharacterized protein